MATIKEAKVRNISINIDGIVPKEVNKRLVMGGFIGQVISDGGQMVQALKELV